jgi:hypothetical protein
MFDEEEEVEGEGGRGSEGEECGGRATTKLCGTSWYFSRVGEEWERKTSSKRADNFEVVSLRFTRFCL